MKEKWEGQITVFLSLILICVCALICGLLESARTAGARCFLEMAVHSAMDSLFSQYNRELWEEYRIFGLEYTERETVAEEFSRFLEPYLDQENWYPFKLEDCQVTDCQVLTDNSGKYFEQEIVDYMKYGIWTKEWGEENIAESMEELKQAEQVSELTRSMEVQTKEALKLERSLEEIGKCLEKQREIQQEAVKQLNREDGRGFCREGDRLIKELKKVPRLIEKYEKRADALGEKLKVLRQQYEEKTEDFCDAVQQSFEAELFSYEAYTDKDGERRQQIAGLSDESKDRIYLVKEVQQEAEEVEDYIENWEPDDEDDDLNTGALWRPVQRHFSQYHALQSPVQAGVKDKEKEGLLEKLQEMADKGILGLVLPDNAEVSSGIIPINSSPSHRISYQQKQAKILDKAMTAEYCQVFFNHFCDTGEKDTAYELEYLLAGKELDEANLIQTVKQLLAVREGLNLIHIMGDYEKRSQAKKVAASIVGVTGILPLVSITAFLIMGVWAFAEAVADVKILLSGGKIPLLKKKTDWTLSLDEIFSFAVTGKIDGLEKKESGLDYPQYLTIFLLASPGTQLLYRMMDVIEMNISRSQPGFQLSDCAYRVDTETKVCGKHVYFTLGLWKSLMGNHEARYLTEVKASKAY